MINVEQLDIFEASDSLSQISALDKEVHDNPGVGKDLEKYYTLKFLSKGVFLNERFPEGYENCVN